MLTDYNHLEEAGKSLSALGFTGLEAEIYIFLLQESPVTGYRAAQALRKPVANTYKAIQSLEKKGAVIVDEGDNRLCRPIPVEELLGQISRNFKHHQEQAEKLLKIMSTNTNDDRIYQLQTVKQVYERCSAMLRNAQSDILVNAYPLPCKELLVDITAAIRRGVKLHLVVYQPTVISGAEVILHPRATELTGRRIGQALTVVADGRELVQGLLSNGGEAVLQAIWSKSTYLSWTMHRSTLAEMNYLSMSLQLTAAQNYVDMRRIIAKFQTEQAADIPGYKDLVQRFGGQR